MIIPVEFPEDTVHSVRIEGSVVLLTSADKKVYKGVWMHYGGYTLWEGDGVDFPLDWGLLDQVDLRIRSRTDWYPRKMSKMDASEKELFARSLCRNFALSRTGDVCLNTRTY